MSPFWFVVGVVVLIAVAWLAPHALRRRTPEATHKNARALHAIRLDELQRDTEDAVISAADKQRAEQEITRALLEETGADEDPEDRHRVISPRLTALVITCIVPLLSVSTYLQLGQPGLATGAVAPAVEEAPHDQASVEAMLDGLKQRLAEDPGNAEAWLLLGRSNMALSRFDEAIPAFAQALEILGDVPQVLVQYADALAMQGGGHIGSEILALLQRALAKDPDNVAALWLSGLGAAEAGETEQALAYLKQARNASTKNGASTEELDAIIRSIDPAYAPDAASASAPAPSTSVTVAVDIAPRLQDQLGPEDTLFVFARSPGAGGPPLAVARMRADVLPETVVLDESMAMAPMFKLTAGASVAVTARVSKAGQPTAQPGDLQGVSSAFIVGETLSLKLVINEVVQ